MTSAPDEPVTPDVLSDIEAVLRDRLANPVADSYSLTLLRDPQRAQRKIMEESFELCLELGAPRVAPDRVAAEAADVVFHVLAGVVGAGVPFAAVIAELERRRGHGPAEPVP